MSEDKNARLVAFLGTVLVVLTTGFVVGYQTKRPADALDYEKAWHDCQQDRFELRMSGWRLADEVTLNCRGRCAPDAQFLSTSCVVQLLDGGLRSP